MASAHERCTPEPCLSVRTGEPGTHVTVYRPTWKVVWNAELTTEPVGYPYKPGVAEWVIMESPSRTPTAGFTFTVPDVRPGTYPVVFFETSENYQHFWWDTFTVVEVLPLGNDGGDPEPTSRWLLLGGALIGVAAVGSLVYAIRQSRRPEA